MAAPTQFQGWLGKSPEAINGKMEWGSYEPKKWTENDVDIEISHCGVCGSDLHTLKSGWRETPYPCVVGHEIVGKAVRVGKNVKHVQVGDRVGVGAQSCSCLQSDCAECSAGIEVYCSNGVTDTYGSQFPNGEGKSYGGYADYNRVNGHWAFKIPEGLDSASAAPMLCGGITVYSPLKQNGCGPGKTVGIVGVGGLGHFAILFAKALGADRVVGISRKADKKDDVLKLGADEYIATDDDKNWAAKNRRSLLCDSAPDGGELPAINAFSLILNGIKVGGSLTGSPAEIREMLQLAADKKIKPWIEERPLQDANKTIVDMEEGKARFRYVLVNENYGKH